MKKKQKIAILGSTGSIGKTSLSIIARHLDLFSVELLSCFSNKKILIKQIKFFLPKYVIINDIDTYNYVKKIKFRKKIQFFKNLDNFNKHNIIIFDKTILGISSIEGLSFAFAFTNFSKKILIANKESIVCGGKLLLNIAKRKKCIIESIDSEHYCLEKILSKINKKEILKIYITASGGPFLNRNPNKIRKINFTQAIKHPNWKMGKKISVDSATMSNKILELIEASVLFNLPADLLKIKIHRESKVHAIIVLKNGLVFFVAHNTSMVVPIRNSLFDNQDLNIYNKNFIFKKKLISFSFDEKNLKRFKIINTGYKVLKLTHRYHIVFNIINDLLVIKYLNEKIFFYQITEKLINVFKNKKIIKYCDKPVKTKNDIFETISYAKKIFLNI